MEIQKVLREDDCNANISDKKNVLPEIPQSKRLVRSYSTETQSTRLSEETLQDGSIDPFTMLPTVQEDVEEQNKTRRDSAVMSKNRLRWTKMKIACLDHGVR